MTKKSDRLREIRHAIETGTTEERTEAQLTLRKFREATAYHEAGHAVMQWRAVIEVGGYSFAADRV